MGSQIAVEHALAGHSVTALGRDRDSAHARLVDAADVALNAALCSASDCAAALARIAIEADPLAVQRPVALVMESLTEDLGVKASLLQPLARALPETVIATNTSSLSITTLGDRIEAPDRTVGMHYWNPPLLMPLVEVIAGRHTSRETLDFAQEVVTRLAKRPIVVTREIPGFVWNRLQFALLREALWLVEEHVATAEAIDEVVRDGLARRWRYTGPFQTASLGGVETFERIANTLFPNLASTHSALGLKRHGALEENQLVELRKLRDEGLARDLREDRRRSDDAAQPPDAG